jgi:predicted amidohydrolase
MRIALAQIVSTPSPAENLDLVADGVERAAAAGARVVVFPEATMCCFGVRLPAEPLDGPWASRVREIAGAAEVTVVAGMFTPDPDGRVRNTLLVTGGGVEAHYDKIHLFDAFGFPELATCYDVRFPGLFQRLGDLGARLVLMPASWGAGPGKRAQWDLLVRARALDSTCVVAACDQADPVTVGRERSAAPTGIGASLVASPFGEVLAQLGEAPDLLVHDVDPESVEQARAAVPVLANRRF